MFERKIGWFYFCGQNLLAMQKFGYRRAAWELEERVQTKLVPITDERESYDREDCKRNKPLPQYSIFPGSFETCQKNKEQRDRSADTNHTEQDHQVTELIYRELNDGEDHCHRSFSINHQLQQFAGGQ